MTLFDETLQWVKNEQAPTYMQGSTDVFSLRYSFAKEHRVQGLGLLDFEKLVQQIVDVLTAAPSVNLSKGRLELISQEHVRSVLAASLSGVNVDETYLTFNSENSDASVIFDSKSLFESL